MSVQWDMSYEEQQRWLDEGNTLVLPFGQSRYVARKLDDGAYVSYHYAYSTFGRLVQYQAPYLPNFTMNERGVAGRSLTSMSPKEQKEALEEGRVFSMALSNDEGFTVRRTVDGCYIKYSPERNTFEALVGEMAKNGPAWMWTTSGPEGELPTHSE